jgi:hypothetical protein
MATEACENCSLYWEIMRALAKGGQRKTGRGHCLDRSVYASNAPGKPTYPPRANTAALPNGCSKVVIVVGKNIELGCGAFMKGK